ncbi:MAG: SUMF1/EgtB/PvdO family nonheme iron enzyme [Sedimentisphaerales bacterium]|nr:SUMF1/EgtB/PvdO family nonheme iron enzyme [Sedimentisphaerales bacterium]
MPIIDDQVFEPAESLPLAPDPLSRCVQLERFGHLLVNRHEWKDHPDFEQVCRSTSRRIDEMFAIVPEGFASLAEMVNDEPGGPEVTVETAPFLMARHAITHARFQKFVDDGGYEMLELWPSEIWPHLIDFKDLTDQPGPRFWRDGRHSKQLADHPVVGVCYYEAAAYAQWAGFRLPTEAEWQMAATWRIRSAANVLRRYPWGDALDTRRCNIWASGNGHTYPVHAYPQGASPNHVLQLIGNVWEWTAGDFNVAADEGGMVVGDMRMSPIRGGAFDTYFPSQATGSFRTGLVSLARVHNVGFRCAWDIGDKASQTAAARKKEMVH